MDNIFQITSRHVFLLFLRSLYLGGHVCQNIWDSAKNNLLLPGELAVNEGNYQKALFMLVKGGGSRGDQKLQSDVFTSFHGIRNCFVFVFLITFFHKPY